VALKDKRKAPSARQLRRAAQTLETQAEWRMSELTNLYFKFVEENRGKPDLHYKKLVNLNLMWKQWLGKRKDKYNYDQTKNLFYNRVVELLDLHNKWRTEQLAALKAGREPAEPGPYNDGLPRQPKGSSGIVDVYGNDIPSTRS
jgi:hypothetical protein